MQRLSRFLLVASLAAACSAPTMLPAQPPVAESVSTPRPFAVPLASQSTASSVPTQRVISAVVSAPRSHTVTVVTPGLAITLVGVLFAGTLRSVSSDKNSSFATDSVRQQFNALAYDAWWGRRNHIGTTVATLAKGSGNTKIKTTSTTTYIRGGVPRAALTAQDNFWDLSTAAQGVTVVPVSSFIKYRCIVTAAEAAKVQSSTVAATAAACDFGTTAMADGDVILGMATIATDATHPFTPNTTALDATGITTTFLDGSDGSEFVAALITP